MTSSLRLTRGALKKINAEPLAEDDANEHQQRLVQEHQTFQGGLTPVKRRRVHENHVDIENEPPAPVANDHNDSANNSTMTMAIAPAPVDVPSMVPMQTKVEPTITKSDGATAVAELPLVADEKALDGAPEGELYVVTVLSRNEIVPSTDLKREVAELNELLALKAIPTNEQLPVEDPSALSWAREYAALDSVRRLAIHHADELRPIVSATLQALVCPAVCNLRSAMARNALLCVQDILAFLPQEVACHWSELIPLLVQRTANEKQFIRDLAHAALQLCVDQCASAALLRTLLHVGTMEKNAQVVSAAGVYTSKCVTKLDALTLKTFVTDDHAAFFDEISVLLNCKVVEGKAATRKTLQVVRQAVQDPEFAALVKSKLSGSAQLDVLKASEIKRTSVGVPGAKSGLPKLSMRERMMLMKKQAAKSQDIEVVVVSAPPPTANPTTTTTTDSPSR